LLRLSWLACELARRALAAQVSLRTLNNAQSAFVVCSLKANFFSEFIVEPETNVSVKLHLRNVVSIFKSVQSVDKLWLQLACSGSDNYLRVQQECGNGLRKKFDLAFEEVAAATRARAPARSGVRMRPGARGR